jgi:hypothetical protein
MDNATGQVVDDHIDENGYRILLTVYALEEL